MKKEFSLGELELIVDAVNVYYHRVDNILRSSDLGDIERKNWENIKAKCYDLLHAPNGNDLHDLLLKVILDNEYVKNGFGYKRVSENIIHWITLYGSGSFQMYSYYTDDSEMYKVYDTGIITATPEQLQMLIAIYLLNHQ